MKQLAISAFAISLMIPAHVLADPPPENAMPLSEILASLEQENDVAYFTEVEWDDGAFWGSDETGHWEIEYVSDDGAESELAVDPITGESKQ